MRCGRLAIAKTPNFPRGPRILHAKHNTPNNMKNTIIALYDLCGMTAHAIALHLGISREEVLDVLSEEGCA